ncbi:hypothetical protein [Vibrio sp. RM-69-4]|uniref:hypothetical protein n=1 Tax=Vibrio sp. RM-69-4 TaxID=2950157 RepID=UPI00215D4146|nr:hypothetical protein [Vibrio sp. RM-69-4]
MVIFDFGYIVPFDLGQGLDEKWIIMPIFVFSSCAISFSLGQTLLFRPSKYQFKNINENDWIRNKSNMFVLFPILAASLVVMSIGVDNLLFRSSYVVDDANLTFRKFADITVWIAIIAIPFIKSKPLMLLSHVVLLLVFVGLGSRSAMVVALSYPLFNYFINGTSKLMVALNIVIATIVSIAVMGIRFEEHRGIIPIFENIINWNIEFSISLFLINYLSSYSSLLFSEYLYFHELSYKYFSMSISPLPGFMLDIDGIDQWARFRKAIPHSAVSQLYGHIGFVATMFVFFFHGLSCGLLKDRVIRTFGKSRLILSSLVIIDLIYLMPVIRGMQYNLRGVVRLEYLVLALTVFLVFALYLFRKNTRNDV